MADRVIAWAFRSSGGATVYETQLHPDNTLTCACPGWCMQRKDRITGARLPRACTHTKKLRAAIDRVMFLAVDPTRADFHSVVARMAGAEPSPAEPPRLTIQTRPAPIPPPEPVPVRGRRLPTM